MKYTICAALAAVAVAVKQAGDQISASQPSFNYDLDDGEYNKEAFDRNADDDNNEFHVAHGESKTNWENHFQVHDLEGLNGDIAAWYERIAKPYIEAHSQDVMRSALASVEAENGKLLETCSRGTECRDEKYAEYER